MTANYSFHPEALSEYAEATNYYLHEASPRVADQFVAAIESVALAFIAAPTRWRVAEDPEIRRYILSRFPFVIYYRWEPEHDRITIYAVMHCSREPGYWRVRTERVA